MLTSLILVAVFTKVCYKHLMVLPFINKLYHIFFNKTLDVLPGNKH
jgi:hypothetical protein